MRTLRTAAAAAALAALAAAPASNAGTAADSLVSVHHAEGHTGYDTVPAPSGHGVTHACVLVRTNSTLVKWGGQATASGHDEATSTSVTCYLQVTGPSGAYTVARTASANGPSASFGQADFVAPDAGTSVCVYAAQARWADGHGALYRDQTCVNLN